MANLAAGISYNLSALSSLFLWRMLWIWSNPLSNVKNKKSFKSFFCRWKKSDFFWEALICQMLKSARWKSFKGRSTWLPSYQQYVFLLWSCVEYLCIFNSLAPLTWGLGREGKEEAIFIISSLLQHLGKVLFFKHMWTRCCLGFLK